MRYIVLFFLIGIRIFAYSQSEPCDRSINGKIISLDTNEPLPFATVVVLGTSQSGVATENGNFTINNICEDEVHLEVRFIGYKTVVHHHDFHHPSPVIYMAADETMLESVIVEDFKTEELQSLSIQRKEINKLSLVSSSIGELTAELSGVSTLKTGSNISKPMIHGLHSNRVLVINDGVRHAYQVWGQEHAPEIDPSHVDEIEVVKGAGTVKYGPEALGGVILYNSKKPGFDEKLNGSVGSSYQTNGGTVNTQLNLGQGAHRFAWNVGAFAVIQGDLESPDYILSNTGKREYGGSFNTLLHRPKFDLHISGSYFEQELGILRGSLVGNLVDLQNAIDRAVPNPTFPSTYEIKNPRQDTEHILLNSDLSLYLGEHVLKFQYGIQRNIRKEFDVRRGELNERPVIDLKLYSHTLATEWTQPTKGKWSGNSGVQVFTQNSANKPNSNPANFVPDYDVFNMGVFTIQKLKLDQTTFELGVRFDFQSLNTADTIRETVTYSNNVEYSNFTFTLGVRKQLNQSIALFSNIGSAWRPPNVAELYSFGYHSSRIQFGLWRYELEPTISTNNILNQSNKAVPSEKSLKWVTGIEMKKSKMNGEFIFYTNYINDYIFLRPFGVTVNIAGTFPYFLYDQTDALFIGSDWDVKYDHSKSLMSEIKISYVHAVEMENHQALLEIPPLNINYGIEFKKGDWNFGLNLNYTAPQWNAPDVIEPINFQNSSIEIDPQQLFDFMTPPDGYILMGGNVSYELTRFSVALKVNNILNSSYRLNTDRLRYFTDSPGRNLSIALEYKF